MPLLLALHCLMVTGIFACGAVGAIFLHFILAVLVFHDCFYGAGLQTISRRLALLLVDYVHMALLAISVRHLAMINLHPAGPRRGDLGYVIA
jgi:hypothetical protein